jgi:quinohemoprotein ethanol dehydrogenase
LEFAVKIAYPLIGASMSLVLAAASSAGADRTTYAKGHPPSNTEWRLIGGGDLEQHFSPLQQINETTVKQLRLQWFADMPTPDGLTGVPLVAGGVVYQSGALGKVWANDMRNGHLLWAYDAQRCATSFPSKAACSPGTP